MLVLVEFEIELKLLFWKLLEHIFVELLIEEVGLNPKVIVLLLLFVLLNVKLFDITLLLFPLSLLNGLKELLL